MKNALLVTLLIAILALPLVGNAFFLQTIAMAFLMAYLATSWNIIAGFAGQFSLAHGALFAIGAYTSTILFLRFGISPWFGLLAAGIVAALCGCLVGYVVFRLGLRGVYFAVITLAFAEAARVFVLNTSALGGSIGYELPIRNSLADLQFEGYQPYYYLALALLVLGAFVAKRVASSNLGLALAAIRQNEEAAASLGIDVGRTKLAVMAISAALVGVGGAFYAQLAQIVRPDVVFSLNYIVQMLLAGILGGLGTVYGPIAGSLAVATFNQLVALIPAQTNFIAASAQILYGLIIIFVVVFAPQGIIGIFDRPLRPRFLRRLKEQQSAPLRSHG
jgi:branched-chain amino acid transport system permease protein